MELPAPFGKYHLLERLAVGGMAEVFLAKSFGAAGFERLLIIKKILPHMAEDEEFITMFIDEARIASTLNHSNIVQINELGKEGGNYYIAMEYCHGKDLARTYDQLSALRRTMPIPIAVLVSSRICEGLEYAHRKQDASGNSLQIIHRDVSPGNILISYDGSVKIIDFGIAKAQNRMGRTTAGTLKGKFGYMSPEQVRGLPLDHRSDVFSVGILLYEMLTGERLFGAESDFGTLEKVRNATVIPPTTYNSKIPPDLERVVMKSLARDPNERYDWAADMQEDLVRFLMHEGTLTTSKSLSAFMQSTFEEELKRENETLARYRQRGYPWVDEALGEKGRIADSGSAPQRQAAPAAAEPKTADPVASKQNLLYQPTQILPEGIEGADQLDAPATLQEMQAASTPAAGTPVAGAAKDGLLHAPTRILTAEQAEAELGEDLHSPETATQSLPEVSEEAVQASSTPSVEINLPQAQSSAAEELDVPDLSGEIPGGDHQSTVVMHGGFAAIAQAEAASKVSKVEWEKVDDSVAVSEEATPTDDEPPAGALRSKETPAVIAKEDEVAELDDDEVYEVRPTSDQADFTDQSKSKRVEVPVGSMPPPNAKVVVAKKPEAAEDKAAEDKPAEGKVPVARIKPDRPRKRPMKRPPRGPRRKGTGTEMKGKPLDKKAREAGRSKGKTKSGNLMLAATFLGGLLIAGLAGYFLFFFDSGEGAATLPQEPGPGVAQPMKPPPGQEPVKPEPGLPDKGAQQPAAGTLDGGSAEATSADAGMSGLDLSSAGADAGEPPPPDQASADAGQEEGPENPGQDEGKDEGKDEPEGDAAKDEGKDEPRDPPPLMPIDKGKPKIADKPKRKKKRRRRKVVAKASGPSLRITSSPRGADILINGADKGKTPKTLRNLEPGKKYFVVVSKDGYKKAIRGVKFKGDEQIKIKAKLKKKGGGSATASSGGGTGYLMANTKPWAKVIVDGKDTGLWTPIPPKKKLKLPAGKHKVTFKTKDGKTLTVHVTIQPGKTAKVIKKIN